MTVSAPAAFSDQRDRPAAGLLVGRYLLGAEIGRGSSATVYAAADTRLKRQVSVKLFDAAVASDPALRDRFLHQTAKAARLRHPHVVAVLDAGFALNAEGEERPFVVTEPAGPTSLRALLDRDGRIAPPGAVTLARQVASALSHAHARGLVHADVKPENVLVDQDSTNARLVDFSLSFVLALTGVITAETLPSRAAYVAPEQVRGNPVGPVTDVYGLGVLLYEMVAGRPPFVAATPEATAERRVAGQAPPPGAFEPSIPAGLEAVIRRALERAPERRWPSIADMDEALSRASLEPRPLPAPAGASGSEGRAETEDSHGRAGRRRRLGLVVPVLAGALALGLAFWLLGPFVGNLPRLPELFGRAVVPNLVGMSAADAEALARSRGLEFSVVGERVSDRTPRGVVVQQAPVAGWQPRSTQPLRVTLSAGVSVPDVRGQSVADANAMLAALGWKVARVEPGPHPGRQSGTIALQSPAPGAVVAGPGDLSVAIAQ